MATTYNYTKSTVNIDTLSDSINVSAISSAVYVSSVFNKPNSLGITFDSDLSAGDKTTLDGIVSAHTGVSPYTISGYIAVADGSGNIEFVNIDTVTSGISSYANIDGGSSISLYGGTDGIDGGSSISLYGGTYGIDGGNASSFN